MLKYACGNEVMVGDTVLRFDSNYGRLAVGEYVVEALLQYSITLDVEGASLNFSPAFFNLISRKGETAMKTKQFTKADLKTGMRVTTTDGQVWTVMKDVAPQKGVEEYEGILVYNHGWMDIKGLDENFIYTEDKYYSLIKVEQVTLYCNYLSKSDDTVVLWEREAPKSEEQIAYDEAVEATKVARKAYELAQKKLEALNPSGFSPAKK